MAAVVAVEEKQLLEYTKLSENNLKYTNKQFPKIHGHFNDANSDLKIFVGKAAKMPFYGHTKILKGKHDYFGEAFYCQRKDGLETYIREIPADGFSAMFEYFYHGCITLEPKLFPNVLEAAMFFQLEWVTEACCDYMVRCLSAVDYPLTLRFADKYKLNDIQEKILRNFGDSVSKTENQKVFLKTCSNELLLDFLKSNVYTKLSELQLFQFILKWIKENEKSRKEHQAALLRHIRFPMMGLDELKSLPQEISKLAEVQKAVEDAKRYCLDTCSQCLYQGYKYLARGAKETVLVFAFYDDTDRPESNMVGYKDPLLNEESIFVEELGPSDLKVDYTTMNQAAIGNFLFAAGGYDKEGASSARVYMFNFRSKKWIEVAKMVQARVSFAMCSSRSRLYVTGGVCHSADCSDVLSSAEKYIPEDNKWQTIASLPSGYYDQAAVHYDGVLYVSGGITGDETTASAMCLADDSKKWTLLANMSVCRQGHSMTALGGKIYAIGGYTPKLKSAGLVKDCNINEEFDTETKQWTTLLPIPERFGHLYRHTGLVKNKIYFLCNRDSDVYISNFDTGFNEFNSGVLVGRGVHKVSVLQVTYTRD